VILSSKTRLVCLNINYSKLNEKSAEFRKTFIWSEKEKSSEYFVACCPKLK